jgi:ankyrin repeat protein
VSTDFEDPLELLLQTMAFNGDADMVTRLIMEGVDPNACDRWGRTALTLAARMGRLRVVERLLAAKACVDPHEANSVFDTPLICAAENGHFRIVQILICAGANPAHSGGYSQATAEFYARTSGHQEIADYLSRLTR